MDMFYYVMKLFLGAVYIYVFFHIAWKNQSDGARLGTWTVLTHEVSIDTQEDEDHSY